MTMAKYVSTYMSWNSSIVEAAGTLFSCLGNAVVTYGHIGTVGNWDIYLSKLLNRKQFINRRTKQKTCNMPLEVLHTGLLHVCTNITVYY